MSVNTGDKIISVSFNDEIILISTDKGKYQWKISDVSQRLFKASDSDRNNFRVSPSGYGIHWPSIDEDLSIEGLLSYPA